MQNKSTFAFNLSKIRKQRGLSQIDLAKLTGFSPRVIAYYELQAKNPSIEKIEIFAKALNISISELTGKEDIIEDESINDIKNANTKTLKQIQKIFKLNKLNRFTVYRIIDALLKEQDQQELEDKNKIKQ